MPHAGKQLAVAYVNNATLRCANIYFIDCVTVFSVCVRVCVRVCNYLSFMCRKRLANSAPDAKLRQSRPAAYASRMRAGYVA